MIVEGIMCPQCSDIIYSRTTEDLRVCSCKNVFVEGGKEYFKFGYKLKVPKIIQMNIDCTKKELEDDHKFKSNKYGIMSPNEWENKTELNLKEKE